MCNEQTLFHEKTSFNLKSLRSYFAHALTLALLITQLPHAIAGNGTSGGGGGVHKSGRYMTFYSAGIYTELNPTTDVIDIPGLTSLVNYVNDFPYVSKDRRIYLMDLSVPSTKHEYYKVKGDHFDQTTRDRLVAEFARVTAQPVDTLELYAVTDTKARRTYLLPGFYLLNEKDQMAILFHEAYWLMHPYSDYSTVVGAEMAFQAVMEQPQNMGRVYQLLQYWGDSIEVFRSLVAVDLATNALGGLITPQGIPFANLFGPDFIACTKDGDYRSHLSCKKLMRIHLFYLSQQYPKSLLLKHILTLAEKETVFEFKSLDGPDDDLPYEQRRFICLSSQGPDDSSWWCAGGLPRSEVIRTPKSFWSEEKVQFLPIDYSKIYIDLNQPIANTTSLPGAYLSQNGLYTFSFCLDKYK